jgi:hypothetical protein
MACIANHSNGKIGLPVYKERKLVGMVFVEAGTSKEIPESTWDMIKKSKAVQSYLKADTISEVKRVGDVPTFSRPLDELPIPEHLKRDEERTNPAGNLPPIKASVTRRQKSNTTISYD